MRIEGLDFFELRNYGAGSLWFKHILPLQSEEASELFRVGQQRADPSPGKTPRMLCDGNVGGRCSESSIEGQDFLFQGVKPHSSLSICIGPICSRIYTSNKADVRS